MATLSQLLKWMSNLLPKDKLNHFYWASLASYLLLDLAYKYTNNKTTFYVYLAILVLLAAKEIIWDDILKHGTPEVKDFLIGALPVTLNLLTLFYF